ncbi:MAG: PspA-associated protein PspAB [Acidimicrobiales bacterium]
MGILDSLLGRTKPVRPNLDALFSLPSAAVTLETSAGLVLSGRAGVCWMPPAGQSAADVQREISELLDIPDNPADAGQATAEAEVASNTGGADGGRNAPAAGMLTQAEDSYGYRWLLLDDADVEDLVNRVHLVNSTLSDNGWGPQLLCSVFGIVPGDGADSTARPLFLVYLFKRGTFYPFAPIGNERRDSELELRVRAVLGADLPVEQDLSRWFPLWDLPLR